MLALVGWFTFDFLRDRLRASGCDTTTTLNVVAAPDIAPIVTAIGRKVSEEDAESCYRVNVSSRESAATAESLAVSDGTERPDVWIPESTMWLQRAQDKGAWATPVAGDSIASSPVVLALTDAAATELGWPNRPLSWADVIGPEARSLTIGFPDPARDPVGVSTLFGLRELIKNAPDPGGASTAAMRKLSPNTVSQASELFSRLPGGTSPAEPLSAFPTSENALLRHNVKQDGMQLVAVYADPAVPSLDYPYVVMPESSDAKRTAAKRFLERLLNQETSEALADAGFRTPDGRALRDRSQDKRTSSDPMTPVQQPEGEQVEQVLNAWAAVNLSGRLLVLLDVSGSMNEPVPGTGLNRMDVTVQAASQGMGLFKPTTKLGMWLFSTKLDGDKDYSVLLPVRTVSEQLAAGALDKLRAVKAKPNGGTGMYDSVLAAYQDGRQNWEPGRINAVVVMTDGKNEDPDGISLDTLLAELGKLQDPRRPLRIIGIGIGPDIDPGELKRISEATGGQAFTTPDPTKIRDVFYAALSKMLCQPPTCQPGNGGG
ncbi:MAG TPA: substrate-binding and VWA domain-containing protein [Actinophytocola sp.]|uniref:substrate-binding and VWA domain-containing protein n=1 Tax=Actinophytocola sp. TaxID=1872138 RepID=UPI002DDD5781|nr:substrate-binding and VWA domain-containing protein [Actinophytocola sp.]HEV2784030.1 substrate-binding and VWA domain-containing protein [Actinophytocola sp.]